MSSLEIAADTEELLHSAAVLNRIATALATHAHHLSVSLLFSPPSLAPSALPPSALPPSALPPWGPSSSALALLSRALLARAEALDELARRLRATALGYRAADTVGAVALTVALGALLGPLVPLTGLVTTGDTVAGVERLVSLAGPWLRESLGVSVTPRPAEWTGPAPGAAGVLARVPVTGLRVERLTLATGGRAWLVGVPGTAEWSPSSSSTPFDLTGDVRLLAGQTSAGQQAVLSALRALGARKGEPVMLAGHSQGGLIAASLAARPDVRREFTITQVVTAGAPIGLIDVPRSVNTLSIEHTDDPVPKADGRPNPVHPGWVTVRTRSPSAGPLTAHRADLYRRTATLIDRTPDPALTAWRTSAAPFLTAPSGQAWTVTVSRTHR